jgi:hypothetical protein
MLISKVTNDPSPLWKQHGIGAKKRAAHAFGANFAGLIGWHKFAKIFGFRADLDDMGMREIVYISMSISILYSYLSMYKLYIYAQPMYIYIYLYTPAYEIMIYSCVEYEKVT